MSDDGAWQAPGSAPPPPTDGAPPPPPPPGWAPPPKPGLVPLRPMTLGTVLGAAFGVLRRNPKPTLGPALLISLAIMVVTALVTGALLVWTVTRISSAETAEDAETIAAGSIAVTFIGILLTFLFSVVGTAILQGIIVAEVARATLGERLRLRALWAHLRGRVGALIGWSLLVAAAVGVAIAVGVGIVIMLGLLGGAGIVLAVLFGIFATLGAIVLWCWISTKLAFVSAAIVLERLPIRAAVARSWRLVGGYFWRTFGIILLVAVIVGVAAQVVSTPISLLSAFLPALVTPNGADPVTGIVLMIVFTLLSYLVLVIVSAVGLVLQSATSALLYLDLRMRKEGLDLELARFVEARAAGSQAPDPYASADRAPTAPASPWG